MSSFQISYYLAVEEDHDITCDQIRLVSFYFILFIYAYVIIIVYSLDMTQSWESVKTRWIPLVTEICGDTVMIYFAFL